MNANDITHAFAEPDAHNLIDAVHPATGLGLWSGETLAQVRARYPRAELVNMDEWMAARAARQDSPVEWGAVTAEEYGEMLGCLPPAYMGKNGVFAVGEASDHHATTGRPRYQVYRRTAQGYERSSRPMRVSEIRTEVQS